MLLGAIRIALLMFGTWTAGIVWRNSSLMRDERIAQAVSTRQVYIAAGAPAQQTQVTRTRRPDSSSVQEQYVGRNEGIGGDFRVPLRRACCMPGSPTWPHPVVLMGHCCIVWLPAPSAAHRIASLEPTARSIVSRPQQSRSGAHDMLGT